MNSTLTSFTNTAFLALQNLLLWISWVRSSEYFSLMLEVIFSMINHGGGLNWLLWTHIRTPVSSSKVQGGFELGFPEWSGWAMPNGLLLPFKHTSFVRVFPSALGSVWMWPIPKPPKLHVSIVSIFNLLSPDWISRFYYSCYWCLSTAASTRLFISS